VVRHFEVVLSMTYEMLKTIIIVVHFLLVTMTAEVILANGGNPTTICEVVLSGMSVLAPTMSNSALNSIDQIRISMLPLQAKAVSFDAAAWLNMAVLSSCLNALLAIAGSKAP